MHVQRQTDVAEDTQEPVLDTFAEVQQVWHPLRRKYDLFLRYATPSFPVPQLFF
jgi:uncharacterized protein YfbU (UPF0304 family)